MRATLEWSLELLPEPEQKLLGTLSVFAGGWTLEAAEDVCPDGGAGHDILDLLWHLVDKSLVLVTRRGGEARYRLLETVRQYASGRLRSGGEEEAARQRHALYFLHLTERAEPELSSAGQAAWLERLERELDNLRAALGWFRESGQRQAHLCMAGALWRFARARLEEALVLFHALGDERGAASASQVLGSIARELGNYARAEALHEESLALWRKVRDEIGEGRSLNYLGFVAWLQDKHERAKKLCEETLVRFRGLGDNEVVAWALISLEAPRSRPGIAAGRGCCWRRASRSPGSLATRRAWPGRSTNSASWRAVRATTGGRRTCCARAWRPTNGSATGGGPRASWKAWQKLVAPGETWSWRRASSTPPRPSATPSPPRCLPVSAPTARKAFPPRALGSARPSSRWRGPGRAMSPEQAMKHALNAQAPPLPAASASRRPPVEAPGLTRREREIALLVASGLTNRRIAKELSIAERTVDTHVARILKKFGLRSRDQVADRLGERRSHETGAGVPPSGPMRDFCFLAREKEARAWSFM